MIPGTPDEEVIARVLGDALRGRLRLGPMDYARIASAAGRVPAERVAALALERWLATDPRARELLRIFALRR